MRATESNSAASRPQPDGSSEFVTPCVLYLAAFYALTWPALHDFGSRLLGDDGDGWQNVWNLWWVRRALLAGDNPWFTDMLFAPQGTTLVGATLSPINGFLAVPLGAFLSELQTFNVLVVFAFVATGWTTRLLLRSLGVDRWPAFFGGAAFTFSSYHMAHGLGHLQLVTLQWVPLFLWAWLRLLSGPSVGRGVAAALCLLLVQWSDLYYALYCAIAGATLLFVQAVRHRSQRLTMRSQGWPAIAFTVTSLVLLLPLTVALLGSAEASWVGAHPDSYFSNHALAPFIPGSNWRFREWTEWFWGPWRGEADVSEFNNWIGPVVLAAAVYGVARSRRTLFAPHVAPWLTIGALFYLLSLGPFVPVGVQRGLTPYGMLESLFPPLELGGMPNRFAVMYLLAAAVLAAFGAQIVLRTPLWLRHRWAVVPFLALFACELLPKRFPTTAPPQSTVMQHLAELPDGGVVGIPWDTTAVWWQVVHRKPMPYGYVARYPESVFLRGRHFEELTARGEYPALLAETGARYIVRPIGHPGPFVGRETLVLLRRDERFELYVRRDDPLAGGS